MEVRDTVEFLLGAWTLERSIDDHRSRCRGRFTGCATLLVPGAGGGDTAGGLARYEESGVLRFGTHAGPASRRLDYARGAGGAATVYFPDGRPFVEVDLHEGWCQSVHCCGSDRYEISTVVRSPRVLQEWWRVRGPGKSYDARSTLTRRGR